MKCKGCKADFSVVGTELPLFVIASALHIKCPMCKYRQPVEIIDNKYVRMIDE